MKEHFFIIGGQRSGTTFLFEMLDSHPNIQMAKPWRPEPKYFITCDNFEIDDYYKRYFHEEKGASLLGEKSTTYYEREDALKRIHENLPNAKIIFIMRNPIHRALSNYHFSRKNSLETRTLKEVFIEQKSKPKLNENISTDPFDYLNRGDYLSYLKKCYGIFPKEQILVLTSEKLFLGNENERIEGFLNISKGHISVPNEKVNDLQYTIGVRDEVIIDFLKDFYGCKIRELENFLDMDLSLWGLH